MNLGEGVANLRQQELHTQIAVLKEQVQTPEDSDASCCQMLNTTFFLSNVSGTSGNRLLWYQSKCYTLSLSAGTFIHLCVSTQVSSYCRLTVYSNMAQCPAVVRWAKIVNELLGMLEFSHCIRFCQRFSRSWGFTHWNSSWIDSADILPHLSNTLCKKWVCQGSMSHTVCLRFDSFLQPYSLLKCTNGWDLVDLHPHHMQFFQVKIFEEDFRKERSDRERMNEEKEDLRRQVERQQGQLTNLTNQVSSYTDH